MDAEVKTAIDNAMTTTRVTADAPMLQGEGTGNAESQARTRLVARRDRSLSGRN